MPNYQKCQVMGHIGRNPELREVGNTQVASFSLAVTDKWTDKNTGVKMERSNWYNCAVWGKQADVIMRYVSKGDAIFCEGTVEARAYMGQDGEPRASLDLKVFSFQFLGGNSGQSQTDDNASRDLDDVPF
jgi:single-strand DNA-binding protein